MVTALALAALFVASLFGWSMLFQSGAFRTARWKVPAYNYYIRFLRLIVNCTGGNRSALKPLLCQLNQGVFVGVNFLGAGAAILAASEGDPNSIWFQAVTRQGTGEFTLKTSDPWLAITSAFAAYGAATLTNYWVLNFGIPSQNSDNTWSVTLQCYMAAGGASPALTDPIAADVIFIGLYLRNSLLTP